MSVFRLDLTTLLTLLEESRQYGSVSATLPSGVLGQKERPRVVIRLVAGKLVEGHVEYTNGQVYALNRVSLQRLLDPLPTLEWHLETSSDVQYPSADRDHPSGSLTRSLSPGAPGVSRGKPRTTRRITPELLNQLSHRQRRVLLLIDGIKSVEQISALLFPTAPDLYMITEVLNELEALGMITTAANGRSPF